jgi:hypothetical protein
MDLSVLARWLVVLGLGIAVLGVLLLLVARIPGVSRLPGDILIQGENVTVFIPLATCLLGSILLTVIVNVIARIANR